jgi:hypothetical protein
VSLQQLLTKLEMAQLFDEPSTLLGSGYEAHLKAHIVLGKPSLLKNPRQHDISAS